MYKVETNFGSGERLYIRGEELSDKEYEALNESQKKRCAAVCETGAEGGIAEEKKMILDNEIAERSKRIMKLRAEEDKLIESIAVLENHLAELNGAPAARPRRRNGTKNKEASKRKR